MLQAVPLHAMQHNAMLRNAIAVQCSTVYTTKTKTGDSALQCFPAKPSSAIGFEFRPLMGGGVQAKG